MRPRKEDFVVLVVAAVVTAALAYFFPNVFMPVIY